MLKNITAIIYSIFVCSGALAQSAEGVFRATGMSQLDTTGPSLAEENAISNAYNQCRPNAAKRVSNWSYSNGSYGRIYASAEFSCTEVVK